jgi:transcriptional regulator with XRE-family HTH domain
MVAGGPKDRPDLKKLAPLTLKPLRRRRGVQTAEVAEALRISQRAVEHFENGKGALNVDRVHRVAALLRADPYAILAAFEIGSPKFAQRCADNKLMLQFMMKLKEFDARAQDAIGLLDPHTIMKAFETMFDDLARKAAEQQKIVSQWRSDADDEPDTD